MNEFRLSIDYGTTNTVAVLAPPGEPASPLLFDGSPQLPSAIYLDTDGTLLTGLDARNSARLNPACYEPNPKRRIDEGSVLLGTAEFPVVDLIATTLGRVLAEARPRAGVAPPQVVLTHPASWGPDRCAVLKAAAAQAGIPELRLVAEPLAAAAYLVGVGNRHVPEGGTLVVYDLGAGTFDVSVVRRTGDTFATLAFNGLNDVGGLDLDERLLTLIGAAIEPAYPDEWAALRDPQTVADRRQAQLLRNDARDAKERLSRQHSTQVPIPSLGIDVPVNRPDFERVAGPLLSRTTHVTAALLNDSRIRPEDLVGLFLVGGATKTPLVSALLREATEREPVVVEAPEQVVALGALRIPAPGDSPAQRTVPGRPERVEQTASPSLPGAPWSPAPASGVHDGRTAVQPVPQPLPGPPPSRLPEPPTQPLYPPPSPTDRVKLIPNQQRHLYATLGWGALLGGAGLVLALSIGGAFIQFLAVLALLAGLAGTGLKLYDWFRCAAGCRPVTIDVTGITVERDGRSTTFPWSQIATVYLHPYQGDRWIACTPLSNERLGTDERTGAFFRNPPGLFLLSGTSGFPEETVREALRRFAGSRYR